MQKIIPFMWFDNNAEEAINFYISIFKNSRILKTARYDEAGSKASGMPKGSVMTIEFTLRNQKFAAINGGPIFKFSQAISLFVNCRTKAELDTLFKKLSRNGEIMMPLDKYPFSERYAFFKDKFGVSWQLMLSPKQSNIVPSLLFVGKDLGRAEAAVKFYAKIFKNTSIDHIQLYKKEENGKEGTVMHSSFMLEGQEFMAMDGTGPHKFGFNESISFIVNCKTQEEVDYFWEKLTEGGQEVQCGWLKDKFGISWQIVPSVLGRLLSSKNAKKSQNVMKAMLQMQKLDIKKLEQAFKGK